MPSRASRTVTATLTQLSLGLLPRLTVGEGNYTALNLLRKEAGKKKVKLGREGQNLATLMCLTIGPSDDQHSH